MTFQLIERDLAEELLKGSRAKVVPATLDEIGEGDTALVMHSEAEALQAYCIVEGTGEKIRWGVYQAMAWDQKDDGEEKILIWGDPVLIEEESWGAGTLKETMSLEPTARPQLFKVRPGNRPTEQAPSPFVLKRADTPDGMKEQWWALAAEKRLEPAAVQMIVTFTRSIKGIKDKNALFEWWRVSGPEIGKWVAACTFQPTFTNLGRVSIDVGLVKGYEAMTLAILNKVVHDLIEGIDVVGGFKIEAGRSPLFSD